MLRLGWNVRSSRCLCYSQPQQGQQDDTLPKAGVEERTPGLDRLRPDRAGPGQAGPVHDGNGFRGFFFFEVFFLERAVDLFFISLGGQMMSVVP